LGISYRTTWNYFKQGKLNARLYGQRRSKRKTEKIIKELQDDKDV